MEITLLHYLALAGALFLIGILGILLNRRNLISLIMSIELIALAININFVSFSNYLNDIKGQVFVLFVLTVAASEIAVMLAALVIYFSKNKNIWIDDNISDLRGYVLWINIILLISYKFTHYTNEIE